VLVEAGKIGFWICNKRGSVANQDFSLDNGSLSWIGVRFIEPVIVHFQSGLDKSSPYGVRAKAVNGYVFS
jgi:hypothetical protein